MQNNDYFKENSKNINDEDQDLDLKIFYSFLLRNKKILITGAAGFIGAAFLERLLDEEVKIIGIDNFNDYYNLHSIYIYLLKK